MKNIVDITKMLQEFYGDSIKCRSQVSVWVKRFQDGGKDVKYDK
jgi:hypothetical protein